MERRIWPGDNGVTRRPAEHEQSIGAPAWLHTSAVAGRVRRSWRTADAVNDWLDQHVGPSTLPPPEFGGR